MHSVICTFVNVKIERFAVIVNMINGTPFEEICKGNR